MENLCLKRSNKNITKIINKNNNKTNTKKTLKKKAIKGTKIIKEKRASLAKHPEATNDDDAEKRMENHHVTSNKERLKILKGE
jgi:hypothetical protein